MSADFFFKLGVALAVTVFFGLLITAVTAGIVSHMTCTWWTKSSWVAWDEQCTAARVGYIACVAMVVEVFSLVLLPALLYAVFKACAASPLCRSREYDSV